MLAGNGKIYLVCNPVKKNWGGRSPLDLLVSEAVSYTHLDVYKRQRLFYLFHVLEQTDVI